MAGDSISALRQEVRENTERRSDQLREIGESVATHNANFVAIEARLVAIEESSSPGILTIIGATIAMAGLLASGVGFVLTQITQVNDAKRDAIAERMDGLEKASRHRATEIDKVAAKQDDVRQRLSRVEGSLPYIDSKLEDVDKGGSRRWVRDGVRDGVRTAP